MKKRKISTALFLAVLAGTLGSCDNPAQPSGPVATFSFGASLQSGKTSLEVGDEDFVVVNTNGIDDEGKVYEFSSSKPDIISLGEVNGTKCAIKALATGGPVIITVLETTTNTRYNVSLRVNSSSLPANGGKNFASAAGSEAIQNRTKILGALEKYAVESHLTGITLFENGGYVKYSSRLDIPTSNYITGYGFGILSEGDITDDLPGATSEYKRYYHSAQTSNPGKINAMSDTGSQVSDLSGYITSSYWGTKMNSFKTGYEWYPVLAKDTVGGKANTRPVPVYGPQGENRLGLYNKWRVYVKTGADGLKFRTNGLFKNEWDNKEVTIEDYEFPIKMLLTGANQLVRGTEMAADKTYGIKGAQSFYNRTTSSDVTQEFVDKTWNDMKANGELGIATGKEGNDYYIEFDLINEIDEFTAMYTLSSNLYSPISQDFVEMLGNGEVKEGAKIYGMAKENFSYKGSNEKLSPNDTTLSVGAYYLEKWSDEYIAFKQNDTWFERTTYPNRYKIKGIKITTYKDAQEDPDALYRAFYADALDSCGVPTQHIVEEKSSANKTNANKNTVTLVTKGDSTFKLNINSCTQERWDYLFGKSGKICVTPESNKYECKPWMSNDNFLNGLYWSINRKVFADNRGVQPSIDYFSNAYLDDPEAGHSYNLTQEHKDAVASMHNVIYDNEGNVTFDDYGFNKDKAISYFTKAYSELRAAGKIKDGTAAKPTTINISINWMYQNDINEYGNEIKKYFEDAFNDPKVCGGKVKLVVEQPTPSQKWEDVYNEVMMKGRFDLAFGAISGNTYNPLNFLEVLKSDNSSGFTLNWGADTSVIDEKRPLIYENEKYSFDALWQVADHGGIVENGSIVSSIKNCYVGKLKNSAGEETNELYNGFTVSIPMEFVDVKDVELDVSKVTLFIVNGETHNLTYNYDKENKVINITIDAATAAAIDEEIKVAQKKTDSSKEGYIEHPFTRTYYNQFWNFELTYTLSIMGGSAVGNTVSIAMVQTEQNYK